MSFSSSNSGSGPRPSLSEINVTPLVDVMLVLLIVFMVTAPMMQNGVSVELPKANTGAMKTEPDQLVVSINAKQQVFINGKPIDNKDLRSRFETYAQNSKEGEVAIQADQTIPYGVLAKVIAEAKKAKITRVGLATAPER